MENIILQLQKNLPFMKKVGVTQDPCLDPLRVIKENNSPRTLILLCGVEGCGKTTFAKKYLSEYEVINLDDILHDYLQKHHGPFTQQSNNDLNNIFFNKAINALAKGPTVLDCANHDVPFRVNTLNILKKYYDKVIVFVFNPPFETIQKQIMGQLHLRVRPGLWTDVTQQYEFFQKQLSSGLIALGVDNIYIIPNN